MSNGNEPQAGMVTVVIEERPGWIRVHGVFPTDFQREVEMERLPALIDRTLTDYLAKHPPIKVRSVLPILDDGFTIAVHLWFDPTG